MGLYKIHRLLEYVFVTVSSLKKNKDFIIDLMIEKEKKEVNFSEFTDEEIREGFNDEEKELVQKSKKIIQTLNTLAKLFTLNEFNDQLYEIDDIKIVKTGLLLLDKVTDEIFAGELLTLEQIKNETVDIESREQIDILIKELESLTERIVDFTAFCSVYLNIELADEEREIHK